MKPDREEEVKEPAVQEVNSLPPGEPVEKSSTPEKAATPEKAPPPVKRKRSFFSRLLRGFLVLLVIFGLGALAAIYLFYMPLQQKSSARESEIASSGQKISALENQVKSLQALDTKNKELQSQLDRANIQVALLKAQLDIAKAQVFLANNDPNGARQALAGTDKQLETIGKLVDQKQQVKVTQMRDRLKLTLGEMASNSFAAQSDLNVLAKSLEELEKGLTTTQ